MAEQQTLLDLESILLDSSALDAIPVSPDYCKPPKGSYNLQVKDAEIKKNKTSGKQTIVITYVIASTIETIDEPPVPDGSLFSEPFQPTEMGLDFFRKRCLKILNAEPTGGVSLAELMEGIKGAFFDARISYKTSQGTGENAGKVYENMQLMVIPPKA